MVEEEIVYRGEKIPVGWYRKRYAGFRNKDGTPYFTPEELEEKVKESVLVQKRFIGRITGARFEKNQGWRLAFYLKERQNFPEAFETKVDDVSARIIVSKLLHHFFKLKLANPKKWESWGKVQLRFWGNSDCGSAGRRNIRLSHNPSIGLICHEIAHIKFRKHNKKMMNFIKRLINYCKKKNYWQNEITRRTSKSQV